MKLSNLLTQIQKAIEEHGDLDLFDYDTYGVVGIDVEISEGQYPDDWQLPQGTKFARISSDR